MMRRPPRSSLFPSPTLSSSVDQDPAVRSAEVLAHVQGRRVNERERRRMKSRGDERRDVREIGMEMPPDLRSEEHISELHSRQYLACRLLLEKKKTLGLSVYH